MLFLSSENIEKIVPVNLWVDTMEKAMLSLDDNRYSTPDRTHIDIGKNTLLIMPSVGPQMYATKLVSVFPENHEKGIPVINGDVILNDSNTGATIALLNGNKLTAMRTAAVACLGLRKFSNIRNNSIGIVGAGEQGRHLAWFATQMSNLDTISVFDKSDKSLSGFAEFLSQRCPNTKVNVEGSVENLVANSNIIFTATTSVMPVLPDDITLLKGKSIIAIGSYKPEMRELPKSLFSLSDTIWVDACHGKNESGDLIYPMKEGIIHDSQIKNINMLINNPKLISGNTHIYKTVGLAIFDLFAASMLYTEALSKNIGIEVKN